MLFTDMSSRFLIALCTVRLLAAESAAVTKVEPPDWMVDAKPLTLRLLVTGSNLTGATVRKAPFPVSRIQVSKPGTHVFFDLSLPAHAKPGKYTFRLATSSGEVDVPFAIEAALPPQGRYQGFSSNDVIYLLMPDRFANGDPSNDDPEISRGLFNRSKARYYHGGDLEGIRQHLPYLKSLGVTAIWTTPVYDNYNHLNEREKYDNEAITDYHGYGAVDFYAVDEHFGTLADYRKLADEAHALGMKLIQDEVANHTGPYHPWVKDPPTPTWFHGSEASHINETWRTWTVMDPGASAAMRSSTLDGWFANILPDLNQDDPECARYLIQNTLWWIGRIGLDGIREDTLPYVPRAFWRDWTAAIRSHFPAVNVVGEVYDSDPALVSFFQAGRKQFDGVDTGVDTLFDFPLNAALRKFFAGTAPATDVARVIAHDALYTDPAKLVVFADLHDMPRFLNETGATMQGLRNAFTFLFTVRGIPMIYYGDELAMRGGDDPDNRRDFPGGWRDDAMNGFDAKGRESEQQALVEHIQKIAGIRKQSDALRLGVMRDLLVENDQYAFARSTPQKSVIVVFNRAAAASTLHIPLEGTHVADGVTLRDLMGQAVAASARGGFLDVQLNGRSAAIFQ